MEAKIIKSISRFIVPFYFDNNKDGYNKIKDYFITNSKWEELGLSKGKFVEKSIYDAIDADGKIEKDLYNFIQNTIEKTSENGVQSNVGTSVVYETDDKEKPVLEKFFQLGGAEGTWESVKLSSLGAVLFKNGVGFLWYEIDPVANQINEYIIFQNKVKELSSRHGHFLYNEAFDLEEEKSKAAEGQAKGKKADEIRKEHDFFLGYLLAKLLDVEKNNISFFTDRPRRSGEIGSKIPDKALLFQYVYYDGDVPKEEVAFYIANGYRDTYIVPDDVKDRVYSPFGNVAMYTSVTGTAYVAKKTKDANDNFFSDTHMLKYRGDYFVMYLLLLYQSYSSANYMRMLMELPADINEYTDTKDDKKHIVDELKSIEKQVNLFLLKGVVERVSSIQHHNDFFLFGKEKLCIAEDIENLKTGLTAVSSMVKECEQDRKEAKDRLIERGVAVFGIFAAISILCDAYAFIDWWYLGTSVFRIQHLIITILVIIAVIVLGILFIKKPKGE